MKFSVSPERLSSPFLESNLRAANQTSGWVFFSTNSKALEGKKSIKGILKEINEEFVIVESENLVAVPKDKIKSANLDGEI